MKKNPFDESDRLLNFLFWLDRNRIWVLPLPIIIAAIIAVILSV